LQQVLTGFQPMLMLVFNFQSFELSPPFQPVFLWPNRFSTDYIFAVSISFQLAQWFSTGSLAVSTDSTGFQQVVLAVSTGFQLVVKQVFN